MFIQDLGEGFAVTRGKYLLAFIAAIEELHKRAPFLYALPKLDTLFPLRDQYLKDLPPLSLDDNYALFKRRVIGI